MLRFVFLALLLLNGLLLALNFGWLGIWSFDTHEPERIKQQHHADQLHIVPASAALATASAIAEKKEETIACMEFGNFPNNELAKAQEKLKGLNLAERLTQTNVSETATHMVLIPPLGSREAVDKKLAELKRINVTDVFVIQEAGALHWGISLGIFKTEEAAKLHLANLTNKGVRTAKIQARTVSANKTAFQLLNLNAQEKELLDTLKTDFPAQELRNCTKA